jgi:hypothetical protein
VVIGLENTASEKVVFITTMLIALRTAWPTVKKEVEEQIERAEIPEKD